MLSGFRVRRRELLFASLRWGGSTYFPSRLRLHKLGAFQHLEHRVRPVLLPLYYHGDTPNGCRIGLAEDAVCKGLESTLDLPRTAQCSPHIFTSSAFGLS